MVNRWHSNVMVLSLLKRLDVSTTMCSSGEIGINWRAHARTQLKRKPYEQQASRNQNTLPKVDGTTTMRGKPILALPPANKKLEIFGRRLLSDGFGK